MVSKSYIPERGDLIYLSFNPTRGHEQKGRRPALVISKSSYNKAGSKLALVCPITSTIRNNPFAVVVDTPKVKGVILGDHVRSLAWKEREAKFIAKCPAEVLQEVTGKLLALVHGQ